MQPTAHVRLPGFDLSHVQCQNVMKKETPTVLAYALLGLLHQQPRSGYDLRKIFESTPMAHYSGSPGAIYPALRRLEQKSLIIGKLDQTHARRPRQVFRPSSSGKRAFRKWLALEPQRSDVVWSLDELKLRFAFHNYLDSDAATCDFLQRFISEVEGYRKELQRQLKMLPSDTTVNGRLALESGIELYGAHGRWARKALLHFKN